MAVYNILDTAYAIIYLEGGDGMRDFECKATLEKDLKPRSEEYIDIPVKCSKTETQKLHIGF